MPIFDHFKDIVVSGCERLVKPDLAIFELAERRFGYAAESMLFIDDNEANIAAAQKLGWKAHHFAGSEGLEKTLRKLILI